MNPRLRWLAGWGLVLFLLWPSSVAREDRPAAAPSIALRLLGPVASLAASVEWIRFDLALRDGRSELAYRRAASALALDPASSGGWYTLARHLIFDRGSETRSSDPAERRRWIRAGLDLLEEARASARDEHEVLELRGTTLALWVAELAPELEWPGGVRAALEEGLRDLEAAAQLGSAGAAEHARAVRARLAD